MELWEEDLYELLAINPEASPEEIKKAYKKLAIELHPDRFPDDPEKRAEATERFGKITNAYNILKDEEERAEYDFARRMGYGTTNARPAPPPPSGPAPAPGATGSAPPPPGADDLVADRKKSMAQNQFDQGKVYHRAKNWQKAIACYKEAVRLDSDVADYHAHLGLAYMQQGLKTPANNAFAAAFKLDKKNRILKEHYPEAAPKGKGKGKKGDGKPSLLDQLMALFQGPKKVAKGKKDAKSKKGAGPLKKAGAKK